MRQSAIIIIIFVCVSVTFAFNEFVYYDQKLYTGSGCRTTDGRDGVCSASCDTLPHAQLTDRRNICNFRKSTPIICCPRVIDMTAPFPTLLAACIDRKQKAEDERGIDVNRRSNNQLEQRMPDSQYLPPSKSSSRVKPLVINEHPHVAALGWKDANGTIMWRCGGVLIHREFVVTAAHCIFFFKKPAVVRVGDMHLLQSFDDKHAVDYDIEEVFTHPKYNPPKFYHSVALLKLKNKPEYRYKQSPLPACVWTENSVPTKKLLTLGYGAPGFGHRHFARRFQSYLTVLPHEQCVKLYDPIVDMPRGIIENQICALDEAGVLDSCVGDFGGPLQFSADDGFKTPYLVGITTFGVQCLDGNPGVYVKLYDYLDWIEKIIKENQ